MTSGAKDDIAESKSMEARCAQLSAQLAECRQAEEALRQDERRYRDLYDKTPVPMQWADEESRLTSVNDAWIDLLGYERSEVIGRSMFDFYAPASAEHWREHGWPAFLAKGEMHATERQFRHKSGEILDVLLSARIERDAEGRFVRGIGVLMDVTALRRAERDRDRYFEMSQDFLVIAGFDGRLRDANPAAIAASGLSRARLLAVPFLDFVHPEDRTALARAIRQLALGAPVVHLEMRFRYRDGQWHWSAWRATAVVEEGTIYALGRDVHEQRQVEQSLRHAQRMEVIGRLTGGVAHDFNNLLTTVIGNLDLIIKRSPAGDARRRLAEAALQGAERGARLTGQLLAFARRQRLTPEALNLAQLFGEMSVLYRRAVGETVELSLEVASGLWSCRVDRAQLEAAVLNLILNARDALPSGGAVTLGLSNATAAAGEVHDLAPGDYVLLSVRDNGTGMTPEVAALAFEPFFTTKEVGKGSGLGLSQVYGFARQSGGTARIESAPGAGTRVDLYLPRAIEMPAAEAAPAETPLAAPTARATILVVEDDPSVRQATVEMLAELGHCVLVAANAPEALTILHGEKTVDLVLSDIVMPGGMSGIELAQEARGLRADQPVVLITGYASEMTDEDWARRGFTVLRKPYRPSQLAAVVQQALLKRA